MTDYVFVEELNCAEPLLYNISQYKPKHSYEILRTNNPDGSYCFGLKDLKKKLKEYDKNTVLQHAFPMPTNELKLGQHRDFFTDRKLPQDRALHNKIADELGLNVPAFVQVNSFEELKAFGAKHKQSGWFIKSNTHLISTVKYTDSNVRLFENATYPLMLQQEVYNYFEASLQFLTFNGHVCLLDCSISMPNLFDDDSGPKVGDTCHLIKWDIDRDAILKQIPNLGEVCKKYNINGHFDIDFIVDRNGTWWFMEFLMGRFAISDSFGQLQGLKQSYVDLVCDLYEKDVVKVKYKSKYTMGLGLFTYLPLDGYDVLTIKRPKFKKSTLMCGVCFSYFNENNDLVVKENQSRLCYFCESGNKLTDLVKYLTNIVESTEVPYKFYRTNFEKFMFFTNWLEDNYINIVRD